MMNRATRSDFHESVEPASRRFESVCICRRSHRRDAGATGFFRLFPWLIALLLVVPCGVLWAQVVTTDDPNPTGVFQPPPNVNNATPVRFIAVDVFIDSGAAPLAAYQFEFSGPKGVSIVGVEGGESNAFRSPPYYDPEALTKGRIVVAAFSTGRDLPTGQTRVARLHLRAEGEPDAQFSVKLIVAGDSTGAKIEATSTTELVK